MKLYLLRHGKTAYNAEKRYQGVSDIPLSEEGKKELIPADFAPDVVYVSPLSRTKDTAKALFPLAKQVVVPDFREMDFGVFEGRNYIEMEHDAAYRAWVDGNCEGTCPGGECKADFCRRTCDAFVPLLEAAFKEKKETLVIVAHGGTQMAIMERYALPKRDYYQWHSENGGGFLLDADAGIWEKEHTLALIDTVQYIRKEGENAL